MTRLVGTVCVVRRSERPMSALEVRLLECAAHTSAAIEHARLLDEERRRVRDLSVINELGALVGERLDLSAVPVTGARYLARITDVTHASIALRKALTAPASSPRPLPIPGTPTPSWTSTSPRPSPRSSGSGSR